MTCCFRFETSQSGSTCTNSYIQKVISSIQITKAELQEQYTGKKNIYKKILISKCGIHAQLMLRKINIVHGTFVNRFSDSILNLLLTPSPAVVKVASVRSAAVVAWCWICIHVSCVFINYSHMYVSYHPIDQSLLLSLCVYPFVCDFIFINSL